MLAFWGRGNKAEATIFCPAPHARKDVDNKLPSSWTGLWASDASFPLPAVLSPPLSSRSLLVTRQQQQFPRKGVQRSFAAVGVCGWTRVPQMKGLMSDVLAISKVCRCRQMSRVSQAAGDSGKWFSLGNPMESEPVAFAPFVVPRLRLVCVCPVELDHVVWSGTGTATLGLRHAGSGTTRRWRRLRWR